VRQAVEVRDVDYPVAQDNGYAVWSAFANHYWPALYFVDADGVIRDQHFGEGRYDKWERVIQRLLDVERELVSVEGAGVEADASPYLYDSLAVAAVLEPGLLTLDPAFVAVETAWRGVGRHECRLAPGTAIRLFAARRTRQRAWRDRRRPPPVRRAVH
jgi:hypothetical protein